jgi:hypothetical protein
MHTGVAKKSEYGSVVIVIVLLLVLYFRVTRGLDLTDEMQYYGEIKGLIKSGRLFSNDLFVQQTVYILFLPIFKAYHYFFEFEYFVFFGRMLLAALSIFIFVYAYIKLKKLGPDVLTSASMALALTFAIPYHGVFALSYNTVSQAMWVIFLIRFFEWSKNRCFVWALIFAVAAFAHPTSALTMAALVFSRLLLEQDFRTFFRLVLISIVIAAISISTALLFAKPSEYISSLVFSSGFGVGEVFFSDLIGFTVLLSMGLMFAVGSYISQRLSLALLTNLLMMSCVMFWAMLMVGVVGSFSYRTAGLLSLLCSIAYSIAIKRGVNSSSDQYENTNTNTNTKWLLTALILFAATIGITSGNGIGQATGAFMIGLPLLVAITASDRLGVESKVDSFKKLGLLLLVPSLFITHWIKHPYRDDSVWFSNYSVDSVEEFKYIQVSEKRAEFLADIRQQFSQSVNSKKTLIIGGVPALYFVLKATPETCMFFMHSLTTDKSEIEFRKCMASKEPEVVLDFSSLAASVSVNSRISLFANQLYKSRDFRCTDEEIKKESIGVTKPQISTATVCRLWG